MTDQLTKLKSEKFPVELRHDKNDKGGSQATGQSQSITHAKKTCLK